MINIIFIGKEVKTLKQFRKDYIDFECNSVFFNQKTLSDSGEVFEDAQADIIIFFSQKHEDIINLLQIKNKTENLDEIPFIIFADEKTILEIPPDYFNEKIIALPNAINKTTFSSVFNNLIALKKTLDENKSVKKLVEEIEQIEMMQLQAYEKSVSEHAKEFRYSTLFEQTPLGVVIIDPETGYPVEFNELAASLFNLSRDEFAQWSFYDWNLSKENEKLSKFIKNGNHNKRIALQNICLSESDTEKYINVYLSIIDLFDQPYYYLLIKDITKDKLSEEKLSKAEALLKTANQQAPIGIIIFNPDSTVQMINNVALQMWGLTHHTAKGTSLETLLKSATYYFPDGKPCPAKKNPLYRTLKGKSIKNEELVFTRKDGSKRWVMVSATPVYNKEGQIIAIIAFFPDITELKDTIEAYGNEKDLLQSLMDNIPDTIYFKDDKHRFTRVNRAMALALGVDKPADAIDKTDFDFFDDDIAAQTTKDDIQILKTGKPIIDKLEKNKKPDGTNIWLTTTKTALYDTEGEIKGIVGISRDITSLKNSEESLKQAKEKAEESDRLKTAFLANMSHEIRTPMNAIIGFSNLLSIPDISKDKRDEYIIHITDSCDNLLKLINDIIDIAKLQAGEIKIKKNEFLLNKFMHELYESLKDDVTKDNIDFRLKVLESNSALKLNSDFPKIRQVLTNLIKNGFKFTEEGFVEFGYKTLVDKGNSYIQFYVKDTGIGIQASKLKLIFETFRKVNDRNTKLYGGTGLGLAIGKNLVELLGGQMHVESTPEVGSIFYFTVPYEEQKKNKKINPSFQKKKTILIVEDEELNYVFINEIISRNKMLDQIWAKNGKEAIKIIRENQHIDLIFMDMKMPEMNGYEATRKIKEINKNIPIIAQTAYAMEGERQQILAAGCNDYISKPIKVDDLESKLKQWLKDEN